MLILLEGEANCAIPQWYLLVTDYSLNSRYSWSSAFIVNLVERASGRTGGGSLVLLVSCSCTRFLMGVVRSENKNICAYQVYGDGALPFIIDPLCLEGEADRAIRRSGGICLLKW